MKYLVEFRVRGVGPFPLDMLRYDECFPRSSEDAASIGIEHPFSLSVPREIELCKYADSKTGRLITTARWNSFGWQVISAQTKTSRI